MKIRKNMFYTHDSTDLIVHILNIGFYDNHVKYKAALYAKPNGYFIEICRFEKPDTTGWQAYTTLEDALSDKCDKSEAQHRIYTISVSEEEGLCNLR